MMVFNLVIDFTNIIYTTIFFLHISEEQFFSTQGTLTHCTTGGTPFLLFVAVGEVKIRGVLSFLVCKYVISSW
jgi:hypothetical protein